ncbi:MAG: ketopantoate reductase family protein, partial [Cognaticolwellia sp.]
GLGHSDLGLINGNAKLTEQHAVEQVLNKALPTVTLTQNIKEKQWLKLAINCVINPITAVHNIDNGQLLEEKYQPLIVSLINEIIAVAKQQGLALELDDINAQVLMVATKTASNCSSMRSDVLHQRQTEIGAINGYITNIANRAGIAVPENDKLIKQVKALEA